MLQLILGRDRQQNSAALMARIADSVRARWPGQILIVPEQFSHGAERSLCESCGDTASRYAEVLSFSRLADRVFSLCGGVSRESLDDGGRFTALALALEHALPRLKVYAGARTKPELIAQLAQQIEEFRNYGVGPDALRGAAARFDGAFAQKLEELGLILESYEAVCGVGKADPADKLSRLRELLWESDYCADKTFYLDGFSDFTGLQSEVLRVLLRRGCPLTVSLVCDDPAEGESIYRTGRDTAARLLRAAREAEQETSVHTAADSEDGGAAFLRRHLFTWDSAVSAETDRVSICRAETPEQECEAAAEELRRLLMAGCRCRELAVACTDRERYLPLLRPLLARCAIPAYYNGRESILQEPAVRAVLAALESAADGMEEEPVFSFLKSPLGVLPRDACDRLQNYVRTWRIAGGRWAKDWTQHPDGYGETFDEAARSRLEELNGWRRQVAGPLLRLKAGLNASTGGQVRALYAFLREIGAEERISALAAERAVSDQRAQEYQQLYEICLRAMEQLALVLGDTERSPDDFYRMLRQLLSRCSLGTIPAGLDCVTVGDLPSLRDQKKRALLVLGAGDGALPAFAPESGILTDQERALLEKEAELRLAPDKTGRMDRELAGTYDVLCSGLETLYLSYSGDEPSYLIRRLQRLYPNAPVTEAGALPLLANDADAGRCAAAAGEDSPLGALLLELGRPEIGETAARLRARADWTMGSLSREAVEAIYQKVITLSASKIDRYSSCRCAYFLEYGLRAKERKEASVDAPIFGTFVHYVLEHTVQEAQNAEGMAAVSPERLRALAETQIRNFTETEIGDLTAQEPRFRYLYLRNLEEVRQVVDSLGSELRNSQFIPSAYELDFRPGGTLPPVEVQGRSGRAQVVGFVDRVDLYHAQEADYVRVVDYKTGKKAFSYSDVLNGMGMQMLIYLFALEGNRSARPAGVLYVPARVPVLSAPERPTEEEAERQRQKAEQRSGLLLKDERLLRAMEPFEEQPVYLPCSVGKDGELQGDLATPEQLRLLRRHVERTLREITDQIFGGNVRPNPYYQGADQSSCRYCPYAAVCHLDSCNPETRYFAAKKAGEFWKRLEEKEHGGT